MNIREALPAEAPRLTEIARRAKAAWGYSAEWLLLWAEELTLTPEYLSLHHSFVCEQAGELVEMVVLEDRDAHWMIEHVWVDPKAQGRGVGRALVEHALTTARRLQAKKVQVLSDPFAEGFYRKLGARRVTLVPASMPGRPERVFACAGVRSVGPSPDCVSSTSEGDLDLRLGPPQRGNCKRLQ